MEKVKLTPQQAESLEYLKRNFRLKEIVILHVQKYGCDWVGKGEGINGLDVDTLIKALYIGYEIEEPFKVGDWVTWEYRSTKYTGKILEISDNDVLTDVKGSIYGANQRFLKNKIRKATPEEIAAEKERRKWAAIRRKVGEYKTNDIVYHEKYGYGVYVHGQMIEPFNQEKYSGWHDVKAKELKLICPVEQRFDLKGDDDESA
ncbi:hypothetical protein [Thermaerobacillus caldiproteolyticus]|uniref:hypothetical protein n=1 Tax=Thermaerobacillus caldiproteolyticus TaxID=247480 RepID=UPI0018F22287|nr:hypothetical protein [Anoxybacillus caldiproteolyticus]